MPTGEGVRPSGTAPTRRTHSTNYIPELEELLNAQIKLLLDLDDLAEYAYGAEPKGPERFRDFRHHLAALDLSREEFAFVMNYPYPKE